MPPSIPAGSGEHYYYRIYPKDPTDQGKLTARNHYVGIDAVAWFINKQGGWFTDRMASGVLEIKMSSGQEHYQTALGTFELKAGARTAPVFEKPVLPDRNYRGGPLTFNASLTAIKRDTVLAGLLKNAASASLGIVAGMVQTATVAGPVLLLTTAAGDLVGGVKQLLSQSTDKREALFDFSGLEATLQPAQIVGPETFVLFHRGTPLDQAQLEVRTQGSLLLPFYQGQRLEDGAWLLLRIRREDEYSGVREWHDAARKLRGVIRGVVEDFRSGARSQEESLAQFKPSGADGKTVYDEFMRLRTLIHNDGVLTEREAGLYAGELYTDLLAAQEAIRAGEPEKYFRDLADVQAALSAGHPPAGSLGEGFHKEVTALAAVRASSVVRDPALPGGPRVASLEHADLFDSFRYLPRTLSSFRLA